MPREVISTPQAPEYPSYSQAVKAGNTIYVAGTVGVDVATGKFAGPTVKEQPASLCSTARPSCAPAAPS